MFESMYIKMYTNVQGVFIGRDTKNKWPFHGMKNFFNALYEVCLENIRTFWIISQRNVLVMLLTSCLDPVLFLFEWKVYEWVFVAIIAMCDLRKQWYKPEKF